MVLKAADAVKLQLDFFYSRPELLAERLMFADGRTQRQILLECKKRGINIGPHVQKVIDRQLQMMKLLRSNR